MSTLPLPGTGGYWPGCLVPDYGTALRDTETYPQNTLMLSDTLNIEHGVNGTDVASPGRASGKEQPAPGRNSATAKVRWTKEINR